MNWKRIYQRIHIILALVMLLRFIEIFVYCLFGKDVPFYSVFILGAPSGIAFLFEYFYLTERKQGKRRIFTEILAMFNLGLQSIVGLFSIYEAVEAETMK